MKYCQILDGVAHWIFEADEMPQFAPYIVILDITNISPQPQEGWTYNTTTNTFTAPVIYVPTLVDIQTAKIAELENDCTNIKNGGFASNCLGTSEVFDSSTDSRESIIGLAMKASLIASGATLVDSTLDWKTQAEPVCHTFKPAQMIALGVDLSTFLTSTIKQKELLQQYVGTLTTVDAVNQVNWNTVIATT